MLGFYNYTTLLTYLSLMSAGLGIVTSLGGAGHPYVGMCFLLFCGLCDAFDGKVARTKTDRTPEECAFGIQIDSLSDIVAFGVLPVCISAALLKRDLFIAMKEEPALGKVTLVLLVAVMALYLLAGMIRLAYFNVTEEKRQETEDGARKTYLGLPVTTSTLLIPFAVSLLNLLHIDMRYVAPWVLLCMGIAFLTPFRLPKPHMVGKIVMTLIGVGCLVIVLLGVPA